MTALDCPRAADSSATRVNITVARVATSPSSASSACSNHSFMEVSP